MTEPKLIKKGQWACICCEEDLQQFNEDEFDELGIYTVWNTEREALKSLILKGAVDVDECRRRLDLLDNPSKGKEVPNPPGE